MASLTTPPLRGTPPTEGNLVWCFIFYFRVSICSHFHIFSFLSRGLTTGSRLWELSRSDTYRIHRIATVALLPRDDKEQITTTLSCHCERSEAIQSINLSQRDTYFLFNSVFAGANKFDYLDSGVKPRNDTEKNSADKNRTLHSELCTLKNTGHLPRFLFPITWYLIIIRQAGCEVICIHITGNIRPYLIQILTVCSRGRSG